MLEPCKPEDEKAGISARVSIVEESYIPGSILEHSSGIEFTGFVSVIDCDEDDRPPPSFCFDRPVESHCTSSVDCCRVLGLLTVATGQTRRKTAAFRIRNGFRNKGACRRCRDASNRGGGGALHASLLLDLGCRLVYDQVQVIKFSTRHPCIHAMIEL